MLVLTYIITGIYLKEENIGYVTVNFHNFELIFI